MKKILSERERRCYSMMKNIRYLCRYREVTTQDEIAGDSGVSHPTICTVVAGKLIGEQSLSKIEPVIERIAEKEGKTQFWECNGQIKSDGNTRYTEPDNFYFCLEKFGGKNDKI